MSGDKIFALIRALVDWMPAKWKAAIERFIRSIEQGGE